MKGTVTEPGLAVLSHRLISGSRQGGFETSIADLTAGASRRLGIGRIKSAIRPYVIAMPPEWVARGHAAKSE
jgi:hypothetical protein